MNPTYHDLHITTPTLQRTRLSNPPYNLRVTCTRAAGWHVWRRADMQLAEDTLQAAEYSASKPLRLDVAGHVIVGSLPPEG